METGLTTCKLKDGPLQESGTSSKGPSVRRDYSIVRNSERAGAAYQYGPGQDARPEGKVRDSLLGPGSLLLRAICQQ